MSGIRLAGGVTAAVLTACVGGGVIGPAGAVTSPGHAAKRLPAVARHAITAAIPGATGRRSPGPFIGKQLTIRAPRSWPRFASAVGGPRVPRRPTAAEVAELGWRGEMAAAYAATRMPAVTYFRVATPGRTVSAFDLDWLNGELRGRVGGPVNGGRDRRLDKLPASQTLAQLQSSLAVVKQAYGPKVAMTTTATVVPLNTRASVYGLEASIRVHRLTELRPHLIDILAGLQTGLTGTDKALIEGLAIDLIDDRGQQAGIWINTRGGSGGNLSAPSLDTAIGGTVDTTFPNLTGGPPTLGSANG
jgi:hypothetical protein